MKLIEFRNKENKVLRGLLNAGTGKTGVICLHGIERTTIEAKFKRIIDSLPKTISSFCFDFSGCGMSDGDFGGTTATKLVNEVKLAIKELKKNCPKVEKIIIVAHSFAACVAVRLAAEKPQFVSRLVLLGPALNQRRLLRYYLARELHRDVLIDWVNYESYFTEDQFKLAMQIKKKIIGSHYLSNKYFNENKDKDYQDYLQKDFPVPTLIVEGGLDNKVPVGSNDRLPRSVRRIFVAEADHNFERPDIVNKYFKQVTKFIGK